MTDETDTKHIPNIDFPLGPDACHPGSRQAESPRSREPEPSGWWQRLSYTQLLRWIGAITLGAAALSFLASGWYAGSALLRTGTFLGFTALLSLAGVFCTYRWKDDKGARTFLALATAFLLANMMQLGAMIHAESASAKLVHEGFRETFIFESIGLWPLVGTCLVSLAVLVPISLLGFSALARSEARRMTGVFLLGNLLLLLPVRDPAVVALLSVALTAVLFAADRLWFRRGGTLRSWDGVAMRTLLFVPVALLLVRNLIMHQASWGLLGVVFGIAAFLSFVALPHCFADRGKASFVQGLAYPLGAAGWALILADLFDGQLQNEWFLTALGLPVCVGVFTASFASLSRGSFARSLAGVLAWLTCWHGLETLGATYLLPHLSCLLIAVALVVAAFLLEERNLLWLGLGCFLLGLAYHLSFALSLIENNLWVSLAVLGTCVILASSYLERHGVGIRQRVQRMRSSLSSWD